MNSFKLSFFCAWFLFAVETQRRSLQKRCAGSPLQQGQPGAPGGFGGLSQVAAEGLVRALAASVKLEKGEAVAVSLQQQVKTSTQWPTVFGWWSADKCTCLTENVPGFELLTPY